MDDEDFKEWFIENLELMGELGVMHYNAPNARLVRMILAITQPQLDQLQEEVDHLRQRMAELEYRSDG